MAETEPTADGVNELYVYRQGAGYAAGLDRVYEPEVPTGPRLAPIPELPPQEYEWNYRVRGGGIYDDDPADPFVAPVAPAAGPAPTMVPPAPAYYVPLLEPAPEATAGGWKAATWCFGLLALAEGGVIAYLLLT